ncbi:uncharacterized protein TrAtP1_002205 [Trichoderma atroviride]|uniref:uncharacterized protein n=1 Tax=Hypocrea atroviridis TaxID=63577 RepID=UPI003326F013|nr:hypothetical protein TrAtP1_002205 [Trichoderma atroviride]
MGGRAEAPHISGDPQLPGPTSQCGIDFLALPWQQETQVHSEQANRLRSTGRTAQYIFSSALMEETEAHNERANHLRSTGRSAQYDFSSALMEETEAHNDQANRPRSTRRTAHV